MPVTAHDDGVLAASYAMLAELQDFLSKLKKAVARAKAALHEIANPFGGEGPPRNYYDDPFIPPWAIGSGLGGLLTPGGNTGSGDPDPTNTTLPPDGTGG